MQYYFDHEKLIVYQKSLSFVDFADSVLKRIDCKIKVYDQLDRASTSIILNIAEGNGKYSSKDRCRYFDISRGSALESAACLDTLVAKSLLEPYEIKEGKDLLYEIVSM
ncbi:MAG: four helix bundle protein, partial [Ignavibacteriaceae bacterium]